VNEESTDIIEEFVMRAKVDANMCSGTGLCEETCPEVFKLKNGVSTVIVDVVPADAESRCQEAAESCPTVAISVEG
jgi:ferredoxin